MDCQLTPVIGAFRGGHSNIGIRVVQMRAPAQGTNTIAVGTTADTLQESWPAPLTISKELNPSAAVALRTAATQSTSKLTPGASHTQRICPASACRSRAACTSRFTSSLNDEYCRASGCPTSTENL